MDDYLENYSDLGRNSAIFEFYDGISGDSNVYYLGASSFKEDLDGRLMDEINGFNNFNLDLISAVPGITKKTWKDSIYKALEFNPICPVGIFEF